MAYLFVHFREKTTPDGEQVYFGLSKDGLQWESVNDGKPILWSNQGEQGVRDHTIVRTKDGKFFIISTDLSLANCFHSKYERDWNNISRNGSKCLSMWESDDLVYWSEQRMVELGDEDFGCLWAPDVLYDEKRKDYIIHWSSSHASNNYGDKAIYYTRTKDFVQFDKAQLLCRKDGSGIIDSAIYEEDGSYYRFLKSEANPEGIILQEGNTITGTYRTNQKFEEEMKKLGHGAYEGPTAFQLESGKWCLLLDYFGVPGEGQGYVPFLSDNLKDGRFIRSEEHFSFPYRFKHGTVIAITKEEYDRIKNHYV
ncbi:glycoside hydrolase family 43 protein [Paenibacillus tundrae]|uniref:Sucrose-6-phosphate hydrolase SacC (GH32 family) n=1 Tax=Paenibacillus tundrae TaxID=528187 RepID=A0ABT9WDL7_9BACL|nr:glycoside hydrolase family 43 protein [Paenibacillus tundrae]MDQ0171329.1 sucrose-6-phosphate hydrolase SacC (GH32 family) [Paenibacillus tundrae]